MMIHQVEDTLFCVPRVILEQSEAFQDMFNLPQAEGNVMEGSDDEHPLILEGYLAQDFKQLLRVLFPLYVPSLTQDQVTNKEVQATWFWYLLDIG
jgi:hypothetical protein